MIDRKTKIKVAAAAFMAVALAAGNVVNAAALATEELIREEEESSRSAHYQLVRSRTFNWDNLDDKVCYEEYKFYKNEIEVLVDVLGIGHVKYPQRQNPNPILAFCLVLDRLCSPGRYKDFYKKYGYSASSQSQIFTGIIRHLHDKFKSILEWNENILSTEKIKRYANDISRSSGGAIQNIWGFIDGTPRRICVPTIDHRPHSSGHKKYHCLKYQAFVTPDGLISLFGPENGSMSDSTMLSESHIADKLKHYVPHRGDIPGVPCPYNLYGDFGYGNSYGIIRPNLVDDSNTHPSLIERLEKMNKYMSSQRISIDWAFKEVTSIFSYSDLKRLHKLYQTLPGEVYLVSTLLVNLRCCFQGNNIARKFKVSPPTVYEYLGIEHDSDSDSD